MDDDDEPWETGRDRARRAWARAYVAHPDAMDPESPGPFDEDEEEEE